MRQGVTLFGKRNNGKFFKRNVTYKTKFPFLKAHSACGLED